LSAPTLLPQRPLLAFCSSACCVASYCKTASYCWAGERDLPRSTPTARCSNLPTSAVFHFLLQSFEWSSPVASIHNFISSPTCDQQFPPIHNFIPSHTYDQQLSATKVILLTSLLRDISLSPNNEIGSTLQIFFFRGYRLETDIRVRISPSLLVHHH
jgi:hypothetical protein